MEPATYREPARHYPLVRIDALVEPLSARDVAVLGSLARMAGAGAFVVLAKHLVQRTVLTRTGPRWQKDLLTRFFESDELVEGQGVWCSPDGRRRLRAASGDSLARWEELDPSSGETLLSVRGPAPLAPQPHEPILLERRIAYVHGRAREPRCFAGLPYALGGRPVAMADASLVVLEVRSDGALVDRKDERSISVGDTFHADASDAHRQLAIEYGDRLGAWHDFVETPTVETAPRGWDGFARSRLTL